MPAATISEARRSMQKPGPKKESGGSLSVQVLASTTVWALLWLGAADLALYSLKPLHNVTIGGYLPRDRNPVAYKLNKLQEPWSNPDLLVVGSSLSQASFACADALAANRRAPNIGYELHTHGKAEYLQEKLARLTGKKHFALDLSVGGCLASDAYYLIKKATSIRPDIKAVVLPIAPRDFITNSASSDPDKTPVTSYLNKKSMDGILSEKNSWQTKLEYMLSAIWYYFDIRADYQYLFQCLSCQTLGRAPDLYTADLFSEQFAGNRLVQFSPQMPSAGEVMPRSGKWLDAKWYSKLYNPFSKERLDTQFQYFEKTLQLCKEKNIMVIVVDMPLSRLNRSQMDKQMVPIYMRKLETLTKKYQVRLLKLEDDRDFSDNDFRDSVHLVGTGGKKVVDKIVESVANDKVFLNHLQ